jgi:cytochrome b561
MKGFAGIIIILVVILVFFLFLFILGISSNYSKNTSPLDPTGIGAFFLALQDTVGEFSTLTQTLAWTMAFFIVQGIFLYVYYKIARLIWVHIPQFRSWLNQAKAWVSI